MHKVIPCILLALFLAGCNAGPEKPEAQKAFEKRISGDYAAYDKASTDVQKEQAVTRRKDLLGEKAAAPAFEGWVCKISEARHTGYAGIKEKVLRVTVDCGAFSLGNIIEGTGPDGGPPAEAILEGSPLYQAAVSTNAGDTVIVSGTFMITESGKIRETSLTTAGGMSHPDFGVRFIAITPAAK